MELYKVKLELELMVFAENESEAVKAAQFFGGDEVDEFAKGSAESIHSLHGIPSSWEDSVPFTQLKKSPTDKTCSQLIKKILTEEADDVKELVGSQGVKRIIKKIDLNDDVKPETRPDPKSRELEWEETKPKKEMPKLRFKI